MQNYFEKWGKEHMDNMLDITFSTTPWLLSTSSIDGITVVHYLSTFK